MSFRRGSVVGDNSGAGFGRYIPGTAQAGLNEAREEEASAYAALESRKRKLDQMKRVAKKRRITKRYGRGRKRVVRKRGRKSQKSIQYAQTGNNAKGISNCKKVSFRNKGRDEKFAKRLRYINDATGALATVIKTTGGAINITAGLSSGDCVSLFTGTSSTLTNAGDLASLHAIAKNIVPGGAIAALRAQKSNLYIKHALLEFNFSSTATSDMFIDFYTLDCIRSHDAAETSATGGWGGFLGEFLARDQVPTTTTGTTALTTTYYGINPFLLHGLGQYWKVSSQMRINLQAGKSVTFFKKKTLNKIWDADRYVGVDFYKGISQLYVFIGRGDFEGTTTSTAGTFAVNCFVTYRFTTAGLTIPYVSTSMTTAT